MKLKRLRLISLGVTLLAIASCSSTVMNKPIAGGGRYSGEMVLGLPHGKGRLKLADGRVYDGEFVNGLAHGFGTLIAPDGTTYQGLFMSGQPMWQGTIYLPNGTSIPVDLPAASTTGFDYGTEISPEDKAYIDATIEANRPSIRW